MQAKATPKTNWGSFFLSAIGVVLAAVVIVLVSRSCSADETQAPIIHTDLEYEQIMNDVKNLTLGPFTKPEDRDLTAQEEHNLRLAAIKMQGLIGFKPGLYKNYYIAGKIAFLLGDYPTAKIDFDKTVSCGWPTGTSQSDYIQMMAEGHYMQSRCMFLMAPDQADPRTYYQLAADLAAEAVHTEPTSALYRMAEARAELQMGHDQTAQGLLLSVLNLDPNNTEARKMLALQQLAAAKDELKSGHKTHAKELLGSVLTLDPKNTEAQQLLSGTK